MKKYILIVSVFIISSFVSVLKAQIYSFEDGLVPSAFTANNGSLAVSGTKFKLGSKSLCWEWKGGSKLTLANPLGLETASKSKDGGIYLWVYNTVISDSKLVFTFLDNTEQVKCHLDYNLNFKGWRCIIATFGTEMKKDKSVLSKVSVEAPAIGNGQLYFDHLEFQKSITWTRMTNSQYKVVQSPVVEDFMATRAVGEIKSLIQPTALQQAGADTVAKRLEQWYTGSGKYSSKSEFKTRNSAVNRQIQFALTHNQGDLNLTVAPDGTVSGVGLYSSTESKKIDGVTIRTFREVTRAAMLPLAYDFTINKTALSKTRYLNMLDWMYDQGWADGSSLGSMRDEKLQSAGYFHSLFLMRNELGADRLNRELNTLNWFGLFGHVNELIPEKGENADDIRSLAVAKLVYALMQPNPEKRATALTLLTRYYNHAFSITPGMLETFKPDFSGYHHAGIYFTQYYPEALYVACWLYYLLHDTPYSLSEEVYSTLKNCLLTYKNVCSVYDAPISTCGRFPLGAQFLDETLPAFAYLALSKKQPDIELLSAFGRLWKPGESPIKENLNSASTGICLRSTMGETEMCLRAASLLVQAEPSPKTAFYLPYAGLMIHRDPKNHVAIKGFSKYVWDYESSSTENLYGRYLSYGQIEYTDLHTGKHNSNYDNKLWDWSRLPGTTAKHLLPSEMIFKQTHRNFSDKAFLGGTALNDSNSMFSMQLHDNAYDKTFSANKSVFCFGNALVCLGSNINDSARNVRTETTLFQKELKDSELVKLNGKKLKNDMSGIENPVIRDNIGNLYIVKSGSVDLIKTDSMVTAVINHGFAAQNKSYGYFMLLQPNVAKENKFSNPKTNPISILRQDQVAHIVQNSTDKVYGYAIFDTTKPLNDKWIQQVNIPSIVMIRDNGKSGLMLCLTDPDMHRQSVSGLNSLTKEVAKDASQPFDYEIVLNGKYSIDGNNTDIHLTITDKTTKIALQVVDGKTYRISLKLQ